jgi:hypothetical protein
MRFAFDHEKARQRIGLITLAVTALSTTGSLAWVRSGSPAPPVRPNMSAAAPRGGVVASPARGPARPVAEASNARGSGSAPTDHRSEAHGPSGDHRHRHFHRVFFGGAYYEVYDDDYDSGTTAVVADTGAVAGPAEYPPPPEPTGYATAGSYVVAYGRIDWPEPCAAKFKLYSPTEGKYLATDGKAYSCQ